MAITLSTAQELTLFQILDCPYTTGYQGMDGMGSLVSTNRINVGAGAAKTAIQADVVSLDDALKSILIGYLNDYDATGSNTGTIQGNIGDLTGISWSWEDKRKFIASKVRSILPYYHYQQILKRQDGVEANSQSPFVLFSR